MKNRRLLLAAGALVLAVGANAQELREGYITAGENTGSESFHTLLSNWKPGMKLSEDDNFYISRQRPHYRFRNLATQVRKDITAENDKRLLAWIPVSDSKFNALPNGIFDQEVFSMWPYVTSWGDWTASVSRIPAAFMDVAHKNGVGVSGVASIPWGPVNSTWLAMLNGMANADAEKAAQFFHYYGIDGLGYNSEFTGFYQMAKLMTFHENLNKAMKEVDPLFENFWYDFTNYYGNYTYDQGLVTTNQNNFGDSAHVRVSLFFNYNWNKESLLRNSVSKAREMGRDPLYLYAGVNMQGGEPGGGHWDMLSKYPISVGLWGAHSNNMFWESRGEKGSDPDAKQNAYLTRTERYFTGGTRNPANCPDWYGGHNYSVDNYTWHGMSKFMTARSALSWDLGDEAFITYFNLGNGKYFNLEGKRANSNPWYNVGMQDYLPTWRWWFSSRLLGGDAADVPATGLDANFTWDDAWFGGSTIRISGSTPDEYLHLFKTQYALQAGDKVTFRYKLAGGSANVDLLFSAVGSESQAVAYNVQDASVKADDEEWLTKTFTVGSDLDGKDLALVALHFTDATDLNLLLGELSIVRGTAAAPEMPTDLQATMLYNSKAGMDGKLIWNMANDKAEGEPCYNQDVRTSYFRLYAQEEGQDEPQFIGTTTSWAGLYYAIPVSTPNARVRLGVAAVSIDHKSQSEIAWSDYLSPANYVYDDNITIDKTTIKPGESFTMSYVDPQHEDGTWTLTDQAGNTVFEGTGRSVTVDEGLSDLGSYDLTLVGTEHGDNGASTTTRQFGSYVQITSEGVGALPEIYSLTANGHDADISIQAGDEVQMAYTGRKADGAGSQGIDLKEKRFGPKCADLDLVGAKSFSLAFWLKINKLDTEKGTQLLGIANKRDPWPKTDWGWIWTTISPDGSLGAYTFRGTDRTSNKEFQYVFGNTKLPVGTWVHIAFTFDYNAAGALKSSFYVNGIRQTPTGWKRMQNGSAVQTGEGDPDYQSDVYNITNGQVIAVGGAPFDRSGIDGTLDNLQVWNKVMTDEDVKTSMQDIDENNLPEGLLSYWDFEGEAASDYTFPSKGVKKDVQAGSYDYTASGSEGQGLFAWTPSDLTSGCPFIAGTTYKVTTLPTWRAPKATITHESGNDQAGQATLTYDKDGVRTVTLTLANSLGSAVKTFSAITIGDPTSIDGPAQSGELKAYTVGEDVLVDFIEAGAYEVSVYNVNGQASARKQATVAAGGHMQIHLAKAGVYILSVKKDGRVIRSMKLMRK